MKQCFEVFIELFLGYYYYVYNTEGPHYKYLCHRTVVTLFFVISETRLLKTHRYTPYPLVNTR